MPETLERMPATDVPSERELLAVLFCGRATDVTTDDVRAALGESVAAFTMNEHRAIYRGILKATDAGDELNVPTIVAAMSSGTPEERQRTEQHEPAAGWEDYLIDMALYADYANPTFYLRRVRGCWLLRRLALLGRALSIEATQSIDMIDPTDVLAKFVKHLDDVELASVSDTDSTPLHEILRRLPLPSEMERRAIPCGLGYFEHMLGRGFERGTLTIAGGSPSTGKTSLGVTWSMHAVKSDRGCPVLFVSVEMNAEQLGLRFLSAATGLAMQELRSGDIDDDRCGRECAKAATTFEHERQPIHVVDGVRDVRQIVGYIRRHVRKHHVGMIVVDYLGMLDIAGKYDRNDLRIGAITQLLKNAALETDTAVVLLCQLNRQAANEKRAPRLSELRDSGMIECDADNVVLIHAHKKDESGTLAETNLIVAKQRQGNTGTVPVLYCRETMTYVTKARVSVDEPPHKPTSQWVPF